MAHTHEFDCKVCGEHLDSKKELDEHNRDRHPNSSTQRSGDEFRGSSKSGGKPGQNRDR
jgi:hypothetical protein